MKQQDRDVGKKVYSSVVEQWTFNPSVLGSIPNILNYYLLKLYFSNKVQIQMIFNYL